MTFESITYKSMCKQSDSKEVYVGVSKTNKEMKNTCWFVMECINNSSYTSCPLVSWQRVKECVDQITLKEERVTLTQTDTKISRCTVKVIEWMSCNLVAFLRCTAQNRKHSWFGNWQCQSCLKTDTDLWVDCLQTTCVRFHRTQTDSKKHARQTETTHITVSCTHSIDYQNYSENKIMEVWLVNVSLHFRL